MKTTSFKILFFTLFLLAICIIKDSLLFNYFNEIYYFELRLLNKNLSNTEQTYPYPLIKTEKIDPRLVEPKIFSFKKKLKPILKEENIDPPIVEPTKDISFKKKLNPILKEETEKKKVKKEFYLLDKHIKNQYLDPELNPWDTKIQKDILISDYLREQYIHQLKLHFKELKVIPSIDTLTPDDLILQKYFDILDNQLKFVSSKTNYNELPVFKRWIYKYYFRDRESSELLRIKALNNHFKLMTKYLKDLHFKTGFRQVNREFKEMSGDRGNYIEPDDYEEEVEGEYRPPEKITYLEYWIDNFLTVSEAVTETAIVVKDSTVKLIKSISLFIWPPKKMPFRPGLSLIEKQELKEHHEFLEQEYKDNEDILELKREGIFAYPIDSIPPDKIVLDEFQYETKRRIPKEIAFYLTTDNTEKLITRRKLIIKDHFKRAIKLVDETPFDLDSNTIKYLTTFRPKKLRSQINISIDEVINSTKKTFNTEVFLDQHPPEVSDRLLLKHVLVQQHFKLVNKMLLKRVVFEKDLYFLETDLFEHFYILDKSLAKDTLEIQNSNLKFNVELITKILYSEQLLAEFIKVEEFLEKEFYDRFYQEMYQKSILAKFWLDEYYKTKKGPFLDETYSLTREYSLFAFYFLLVSLFFFKKFNDIKVKKTKEEIFNDLGGGT